MKAVVLEGKSYTKASEVAKQFGYTADYIGQLCRGKKIDARLVGRTWFVHIPSVEAHRDQRYALQKAQTVAPGAASKVDTMGPVASSRESVDIPSKKYVKRMVPPPPTHRRFTPDTSPQETFFNPRPKYESDEYVLNPRIAKEPKITLLKVGIAESEQLRIQSAKKTSTRLEPEPLPEVVLKGRLSISRIPDEESDIETDTKEESAHAINHVLPEDSSERDNQENKDEVTLHPESEQTGRGLKVTINHTPSSGPSSRRVVRQSDHQARTADRFTYQVAISRADSTPEVPFSSSDESFVKEVAIVSPWQTVRVVSFYVVGLCVTILTASTFLMAGSEVLTTAAEPASNLVLQPASLMEIFALLRW